jgi:hypothetical protein
MKPGQITSKAVLWEGLNSPRFKEIMLLLVDKDENHRKITKM